MVRLALPPLRDQHRPPAGTPTPPSKPTATTPTNTPTPTPTINASSKPTDTTADSPRSNSPSETSKERPVSLTYHQGGSGPTPPGSPSPPSPTTSTGGSRTSAESNHRTNSPLAPPSATGCSAYPHGWSTTADDTSRAAPTRPMALGPHLPHRPRQPRRSPLPQHRNSVCSPCSNAESPVRFSPVHAATVVDVVGDVAVVDGVVVVDGVDDVKVCLAVQGEYPWLLPARTCTVNAEPRYFTT